MKIRAGKSSELRVVLACYNAFDGGRTVSDGFDSRLLAERRGYFGPLPKERKRLSNGIGFIGWFPLDNKRWQRIQVQLFEKS
jgi:hypothetical protein